MHNEFSVPLPWQVSIWNNLIKRWKDGLLPHGLLFSGAKGLGKHQFALQLAKVYLCEVGKESEQPCNQCKNCELINAGTHPDLLRIEMQEGSKVIKIDQIREFSAHINQTSYLGSLRIALFMDAHTIHAAAANALLKTLEEPPPNCLLILVTHRYASLPATLRSRCQIIKFITPTLSISKPWLKQNAQIDQETDLLLKLAEGAPLEALNFANEQRLAQRQRVLASFKNLAEKTADPLAEAAACNKIPLNEIISDLSSIIKDIVRVQQIANVAIITNDDYSQTIDSIARGINHCKIFEYLAKLESAQKIQDSSNLNQQLFLEELFCTWYEYARNNN